MSLIPADESSGDERTPRQHGDSTAEPSFAGRLVRGARRLVAAAVRRLRSRNGPSRSGDGGEGFLPKRDRTTRKPVAASRGWPATDGGQVDPPPCPRVGDLPAREKPLTFPAEEYADNPAELVAERDGETVTLTLPDREGATITSDVWEPVEP